MQREGKYRAHGTWHAGDSGRRTPGSETSIAVNGLRLTFYILITTQSRLCRHLAVIYQSVEDRLNVFHSQWMLPAHQTTTLLLQLFYSPFVRDYPDEPVREETFNHSHLSWSSIILHQLTPSTTIHSILPVQFMCLTVFLHNLSPCPLWSTSWSGTLHFIRHTFLHPIIVFFSQHMPIPLQPVLL